MKFLSSFRLIKDLYMRINTVVNDNFKNWLPDIELNMFENTPLKVVLLPPELWSIGWVGSEKVWDFPELGVDALYPFSWKPTLPLLALLVIFSEGKVSDLLGDELGNWFGFGFDCKRKELLALFEGDCKLFPESSSTRTSDKDEVVRWIVLLVGELLVELCADIESTLGRGGATRFLGGGIGELI